MTVLVGQTTSGVLADSAAAGNTIAFPFVASANGTAVTMFCQLKVANATFSSAKLGFYSNGAGIPGTLLDSVAVPSGFAAATQFQATLTGAVAIVSGTTYWLAFSGTGEQIDLQGVALAGKEGTGVMGAGASFSGTMSNAPIIWIEDAGGAVSAGYPAQRPTLLMLQKFQPPGRMPRLGFGLPNLATAATPVSTPQTLTADTVLVTASMQRQANKNLAATAVAATAAMAKQVNKNLAATAVAATASMARQVNKALTATTVAVTATLATLKVILKTLTATTVVVTASMVKQVNKNMSGTAVAVTASVVKQVNKNLTATTVAVTATLAALKVILKALTATSVVVTATMQRQVNKALTASAVAVTATMTKQVGKTLRATTVAVTASLAALKVILKTLTATTVLVTASMQRQTQKNLSVTVAATSSIVKRVAHAMSATPVAVTGSMVATFVSGAVGAIYTRFFARPNPDDAGLSGTPAANELGGSVDSAGIDGDPDANTFGRPNPRRN